MTALTFITVTVTGAYTTLWGTTYFDDLEPLLRRFRGRPHWGKKHSLKAPQLRMLYPEWTQFQDIRRSVDPDDIFMNDYLRELFGEEER